MKALEKKEKIRSKEDPSKLEIQIRELSVIGSYLQNVKPYNAQRYTFSEERH